MNRYQITFNIYREIYDKGVIEIKAMNEQEAREIVSELRFDWDNVEYLMENEPIEGYQLDDPGCFEIKQIN